MRKENIVDGVKEIMVTTIEELDECFQEFDLQDGGMSGLHPGWHWYYDECGIADVYFRMD